MGKRLAETQLNKEDLDSDENNNTNVSEILI